MEHSKCYFRRITTIVMLVIDEQKVDYGYPYKMFY